jgi:oligopeptide/dipeptide ABC transporter ATP-binding protein
MLGSTDFRSSGPLLRVEGLKKVFPAKRTLAEKLLGAERKFIRAIDGVDLFICRGETLGIIGESGCGKTTLGRTILQLVRPTEGMVAFDGIDLGALSERELRSLRQRMQIIFQDPYSSLNPRKKVRAILGQALAIHGLVNSEERKAKVKAILEQVGLHDFHLDRYPHQFSGGQRQRIGIARALILNPDFVVCDEPVSALDVSIQAQILSLLQDLKEKLKLTLLFISHDLAVIGTLSNRIAVMYLGKIVELGSTEAVIRRAAHPYTQALLKAAPRLDRVSTAAEVTTPADMPSPLAPPPGCTFHPRCPHVMPICRSEVPHSLEIAAGHRVSCHLYRPS